MRKSVKYGLVGAVVLGVSSIMGPLDLVRTGANYATGEDYQLKAKLLNYCRDGLRRVRVNPSKIENVLAQEINYDLRSESDKIDPDKASVMELWDCSERYGLFPSERIFWPNLEREY